MSDSIFGRIVDGNVVEQWCLDLFRTWSSTYIAECERQRGLDAGSLQRFRSYMIAPTFDSYPEDQLPRLLLVSVGLSEAPLKGGDGRYRARWQMGLGVVTSARTQQLAHAHSMLYMSALRTLLLQRPSLDGNAAGVVWQDEDYTPLSYDDVRTLGAGQAVFTVEVDDVASAKAGPLTPDLPLEPDTDPWPAWPTVQLVDTEIEVLEGGADASRS